MAPNVSKIKRKKNQNTNLNKNRIHTCDYKVPHPTQDGFYTIFVIETKG